MIKRALLLAGALLLLSATPALAQYTQPGVVTSSPTVAPGDDLGVTACCFPPGSTVTFSIGGVVLGTAIANEDGVATGTFQVPANVPAGAASVSAAGVDSMGNPIVQSGGVAVGGATSPTTARVGGLPVTGSDAALPLSILAVFLLAGGGLAVLAGKRRTSDVAGRS